MIWTGLIDAVRALVFAASHVCGESLGGGILLVSFAIRIALLPMTLRIAVRMRDHQARLAALNPELERLRRRYANDRAGLAQATMDLYRQHGLTVLPRGVLSSAFVQMPIGAALYRALGTGLRPQTGFLWISDLARPNALVALLAAALAGATIGAGPSASKVALVINVAFTGFFAWRLSAAVGLYWAASNSVSAVQALMLRRSAPAARAA